MKIKLNEECHKSISEIMLYVKCIIKTISKFDRINSKTKYTIDYIETSKNDDETINLIVSYIIYANSPDAFLLPPIKEKITFTLSKDETKKFLNLKNNRKYQNDYLREEICQKYLEELDNQLTNLLGSGYHELDDIVWYNGLSKIIISWKYIANNNYVLKCPDNYGYKNYTKGNLEDERTIGQLQMLWMIAVTKFGDYGTSPRYGWIESDNYDQFCEWCDAICYTAIADYYELDMT